MAQDTDRTRDDGPDRGGAPDEPTTQLPGGLRPAPSAGPGEYVGKAQPIDPARRRSASGERPASPADREAPPAPARPGEDRPVAETGTPPDSARRPRRDEAPEVSEPPPAHRPPTGRAPRRTRQAQGSAVDQVRRSDFPIALRGYDRAAVDAYVADMAQLVEQLEATQLPDTVVQRALDDVGEETSAILRQAHETAEEIATRSRSQAAGRLERAEREADALRREAEDQARQVEDDVRLLWEERARLLDELRRLAEEVLGVADDALDRLTPAEERADPDEPTAADPVEDDEGLPEDAAGVDAGDRRSATPEARPGPEPADEGGPQPAPARPPEEQDTAERQIRWPPA